MTRRVALADFLPKGLDKPGKPKRKRRIQLAPVRPAPASAVVEAALTEIGAPAGQRIICDYPPNALNPNRTVPWRKKATAKKRYRRDCCILAMQSKAKAPADGRIQIRLDMFPPDPAERDDDNAEASFKAGRDGIAEALGVDDSRFAVERHLHRRPLGCVVFTILEGAAA